jgi:hypothetical protein
MDKLRNILGWMVLLGWIVMLVCVILMMWSDFVFWAKVFVTVAVLIFAISLTEKAIR